MVTPGVASMWNGRSLAPGLAGDLDGAPHVVMLVDDAGVVALGELMRPQVRREDRAPVQALLDDSGELGGEP